MTELVKHEWMINTVTRLKVPGKMCKNCGLELRHPSWTKEFMNKFVINNKRVRFETCGNIIIKDVLE